VPVSVRTQCTNFHMDEYMVFSRTSGDIGKFVKEIVKSMCTSRYLVLCVKCRSRTNLLKRNPEHTET
jgi:hypothetical protein